MREEVTTQKKYTDWKVLRGSGTSHLTTKKPMTPEQALRHFHAIAVWGE